VTLQIAGDYDQTILRDILCSVNGVKSTRISFDENEVQLAYSSELTSKQEIVSQLKSKGYDVSFAVK
jgi:copper chaperone CopZ